MSNQQPATGYLTSFAVTYQIEGVDADVAARIAAGVQRALETNLPEMIAAAAEAGADRRVLGIRVERRGALVEEYDR
ncbi:hypothetical protein [Mycolicibacterium sp.]|uniref:hypothetical protein n=1 Tax=Mycolicibacterium sp. TaxID=2320850 RepID=UPI003560BBC5